MKNPMKRPVVHAWGHAGWARWLGRWLPALIGPTLLAGAAWAAPKVPSIRAAAQVPQALQAPLLGLACPGQRQVAVGEHGVVLLSDDLGQRWRQARHVPMDVTLTAVSFADARHGWAVGHRGAVLHTQDGGETWRIQRHTDTEDKPLFSVHFFNAREGVAVGLWSTVLRTEDGGQTWQAHATGLPKAGGLADLNLFHLFQDRQGRLLATAERGMVLRSADHGRSWEALPTGHAGSLWSGVALESGALLVGGLRGALLRSDDDGRSWQAVGPGNRDSLTALAASGNEVLAVGADGAMLRSSNGGGSFTLARRADRQALLAAARCPGPSSAWTVLGAAGPVGEDAPR